MLSHTDMQNMEPSLEPFIRSRSHDFTLLKKSCCKLSECSKSYTKRELLCRIVHFKELYRKL